MEIDPKKLERLEKQVSLAELLQDMLLKEYETKLRDGALTDTGMANLQKLLMSNGWSIDPSKLPQGLAGVLTTPAELAKMDDEEDDVISLQARRMGMG